ncbi:hypothetical protein IAU60_003543 [Kwoniella sp. DSM 27419]
MQRSGSSHSSLNDDDSPPATGHLGIPQRPSLGQTPSSEPLIPEGDNMTSNPFSSNNNLAAQARGTSTEQPRQSTSFSSGSIAAPKIRINDMPNSPQDQGAAQVPSHAVPDFSRKSHGSVNSILTSPSSSYKPTTSAVEVNSSKGNIAARRAMRMRQAQGTEKGGKGYAPPTKGALNRKAFQSTRLKGEIYKPWLEQRDPALRWARWITIVSIILGVAIAGVICYDGYASVPKLGKVCPVLNDDFSSGSIDSSKWQHEVRLDGYGYGSFQWTTNDAENSFVKDNTLYIVPTLTSDKIGNDAITNGYTLNLTADGSCTSTNVSQCVAVSNSSQLTIINPVRTARLITKNTVNIKYGKVEVKAKFPTGDWLWPRISLLPANNTYGPWPRSGQINSDLHWGPVTDLDRQYLTWGYREQRRTYYSQKYHTFGLEWNDKYMWTCELTNLVEPADPSDIDSRVSQVISFRFNKESFWQRGKFPGTYTNNTEVIKLINPWAAADNNVAPFDQPFYLAIDLAVGAQDGWFPDGEGGKPWIDQSGSAMSDFWAAKSRWWDSSWSSDPTVRGFAIDSVKMWEKC